MMNKKPLIFIIILIALVSLLGVWFWWRNVHSREVLRLEILAPSQAEAGTEVVYTVRYKNNGNIRLEEARLIFEFPENSVISKEEINLPEDKFIIRGQEKIEVILDDIQPGEERTKEFRGVIFGLADSTLTAHARINYRPRNLRARFEARTSQTLMVLGIPLTFEVHLPSRIEPEKRFTFEINYFSRTRHPLSDLRIKIDYPADFRFESSRPRPSFEENEWEIGVLNKGQGGRIEISGFLKGRPPESKIFRAVLGFWQEGRFVPLKESIRGVQLASPAIFITYQVNGNPNYIANPGEYLYYEIFFINAERVPLEDLFMTVKLNEEVVDFNYVRPGQGDFQKSVGTILWDSTRVSALRFLPTEERGEISFWIKVRDDIEISNPAVRAEIFLSHVNQRITTKVNSRVSLFQRGYFDQGPFINHGTHPPVVGLPTNYTIHWQVENHQNEIRDGKVRAILSPGVRLSGNVLPQEAKISFDPESREVVWDIGRIPMRTGLTKPILEVFFQVIFDLPRDQGEVMADLISPARLTGLDTWTEATVSATTEKIDITLIDEIISG